VVLPPVALRAGPDRAKKTHRHAGYAVAMRLTPNQMVLIFVAVVGAGVLLALAFGASLSDLPWGAIILAGILAVVMLVVHRRRQRAIQAMEDERGDHPG
jgi:hypothetical protein